jgi:hypothetical protein
MAYGLRACQISHPCVVRRYQAPPRGDSWRRAVGREMLARTKTNNNFNDLYR